MNIINTILSIYLNDNYDSLVISFKKLKEV